MSFCNGIAKLESQLTSLGPMIYLLLWLIMIIRPYNPLDATINLYTIIVEIEQSCSCYKDILGVCTVLLKVVSLL